MSYVITDNCKECGACLEVCGQKAIFPGNEKYEIDVDLCNDCGACKKICPVDAPEKDD